jgi:Na+-driven multidrug efflux pump
MVGLNLGARQVQRAEKAVRIIGRAAVGITAALVLVLLFAAPWVLGWFNLGPEASAAGVVMLRWLCVGYLLQTVTLVYDYAQVGAGDTVSPMLVNLAALWLVQLPLAWALARGIGLGPRSIWASLVLGWGVQAGLMVRRFRAARWQSLQV